MLDKIKQHRRQPEDGFGWIIVMASFLAMFIILGYPRNLGLFLNLMINDFESTTVTVGSIASIPVSLLYITGPISGILCKRFGCRFAGVLGGIFVFVGLGIAFYTKSIFYLVIGLGILPGLGFGMVYNAVVVIISRYFDQMFAVANGIAFLGGSVSFVISPIIAEFLLAEYGWRWTFLIASGFALHLVFCGFLMRPIPLQQDTQRNEDRSEYELVKNSNQQPTSEEALISNKDPPTNSVFEKLKDAAIYIELNLFRDNAMFLLIVIVSFLNGFSYEAWLVYLIPQAQEMNVSQNSTAFIFTLTGLGALVGRIAQIVILHFDFMTPYNVWNVANILAAFALILNPIFYNVIGLATFSIMYGVATGIILPVSTVLVRNSVGVGSMHVAFGWRNMALGLGALIGGTLIGYWRSLRGAYREPFILLAVVQFLAVLLLNTNIQNLGRCTPSYDTK